MNAIDDILPGAIFGHFSNWLDDVFTSCICTNEIPLIVCTVKPGVCKHPAETGAVEGQQSCHLSRVKSTIPAFTLLMFPRSQ